MSTQIFPHLFLTYDIINYLHDLYLKYEKYISFDSFTNCGKGIDTIYDVIQSNSDGPILLYVKLVHIKKYNESTVYSSSMDYYTFMGKCLLNNSIKSVFSPRVG